MKVKHIPSYDVIVQVTFKHPISRSTFFVCFSGLENNTIQYIGAKKPFIETKIIFISELQTGQKKFCFLFCFIEVSPENEIYQSICIVRWKQCDS